MKNTYERFDISKLKDKVVADYTSTELVALAIQKYPHDPKGAVQYMYDMGTIGSVLYSTTMFTLEAIV